MDTYITNYNTQKYTIARTAVDDCGIDLTIENNNNIPDITITSHFHCLSLRPTLRSLTSMSSHCLLEKGADGRCRLYPPPTSPHAPLVRAWNEGLIPTYNTFMKNTNIKISP